MSIGSVLSSSGAFVNGLFSGVIVVMSGLVIVSYFELFSLGDVWAMVRVSDRGDVFGVVSLVVWSVGSWMLLYRGARGVSLFELPFSFVVGMIVFGLVLIVSYLNDSYRDGFDAGVKRGRDDVRKQVRALIRYGSVDADEESVLDALPMGAGEDGLEDVGEEE